MQITRQHLTTLSAAHTPTKTEAISALLRRTTCTVPSFGWIEQSKFTCRKDLVRLGLLPHQPQPGSFQLEWIPTRFGSPAFPIWAKLHLSGSQSCQEDIFLWHCLNIYCIHCLSLRPRATTCAAARAEVGSLTKCLISSMFTGMPLQTTSTRGTFLGQNPRKPEVPSKEKPTMRQRLSTTINNNHTIFVQKTIFL